MRKSTRRYIPLSKMLCDKAALRAKKRSQIAAATDEYIEKSDAAIFEKLISLPQLESAATVFLYYSVGREVSTIKLLKRLLEEGRRVALPKCRSCGEMSFRLLESLEQLLPGRFGIPEPEGEEVRPERGDIIIVPALCCDAAGNRLGHGAGYYDRYLAGTDAFTVCLCRAEFLEESLPAEDTDVAVDMVITD